MQVPDYREIEIPVTLQSLKNYIEPLLYQIGTVRDSEEILQIVAGKDTPDIVWLTICVKKHQEVDIFNH